MKKLFDGVLMGLGIVLVLVIFVIGFLKVQARLPDSDGLTAQNGDKLTVAKINSLVPSTSIMAFYATTCPTGRKPADGTNGTPDLRGQFIRGLNTFDSGLTTRSDGNQDPDGGSRTIGNFQNDMIKTHTHSYNTRAAAAGGGSRYVQDPSGSNTTIYSCTAGLCGNETRGKNVALIFCMKK